MDDGENPEHIERMLNVMTLKDPRTDGHFFSRKLKNKIGKTGALQKIIERVYHQTERRKVQDLKRALAVIKREENSSRKVTAPVSETVIATNYLYMLHQPKP